VNQLQPAGVAHNRGIVVRKTVLVIERNEINRVGLAVVLRREGYRVLAAAGAQEALDHVRSCAVGLILLDVAQPDRDAQTFLRYCDNDPTLAAIPIVLTTNDRAGCLWAKTKGAAGFLRKPFDQVELLTEVRRHLG